MKYIVLIGRILFSLIFIMTLASHFKSGTANYAAAHGVPMPNILVPLSGILAALGGLSILLGYKTRIGAWLIVAFLVPVTFMMHAFWKETDPMQQQMQMGNFMKNLSLMGGALIISYFGAGPLSIDSKSREKTQKELIKKPGIPFPEEELKGIKQENVREKIKMELSETDFRLDHFWQNADNPNEVKFIFTSDNLNSARNFIKRSTIKKNLPQII